MSTLSYNDGLQQSPASHESSFLNAQRCASLYVVALWGCDFRVQREAACESDAGTNPYIENGVIYLPGGRDDVSGAANRYRAMAAHAAAHLVYGGEAFDAEGLRPRQQVLIGLIEDARVECLAAERFPGLRKLWLSCFPQPVSHTLDFPGLVHRLAYALLNPECDDDNAWVRKGVKLFRSRHDRIGNNAMSVEVGLKLAHDLGQMRISMDEGRPFHFSGYHDDNRHLWSGTSEMMTEEESEAKAGHFSGTKNAFLVEDDTGRVLELSDFYSGSADSRACFIENAGDDAVLEYRLNSAHESADVHLYPEWNYLLQVDRKNWCSVKEKIPAHGDASLEVRILTEYRSAVSRLRNVVRALRHERIQRVRRQDSGDDIDIDDAIVSMMDARAGLDPGCRVHVRARPVHDRGLASLVLLDLSASTNNRQARVGRSVLELARDATFLLAKTMDELDEAFAVHGFCSSGRHDVSYYRLKDFSEDYSDDARARIAGITGQHSTRMGAAIRHAYKQLSMQIEQRKLLLIVTDGEPSDIDVYDPEYMVNDARQAVKEARRDGVYVFCLSLDQDADHYASYIFGLRHFLVLDRVERLPDRLPRLFLSLIRHY